MLRALSMRAETFALTLPEPHPKTLPPAANAEALMSELRAFIVREVRGARHEIERSRALLGEAIAQLTTGFRSVEEQSRVQRSILSRIAEPDGSGASGLRPLAQTASQLAGGLAQVLDDDSRENRKTVELIDQIVKHLDGLFDALNGLKAEGALELAMRTTFTLANVRTRVEESIARGSRAASEGRSEAGALLERAGAMDRLLAGGMAAMSGCTERIRDDLSCAVRSLQFEDIVTQALAAAHTHLDRLQDINQDAIHLQAVLINLNQAPDMRDRALEGFARDLQRKKESWQAPLHKPMSRTDLSAGDVELF